MKYHTKGKTPYARFIEPVDAANREEARSKMEAMGGVTEWQFISEDEFESIKESFAEADRRDQESFDRLMKRTKK